MIHEHYTYTVENPSAIRSIALTDVDARIEVLSSGDGSMYASYFESDKEEYEIEEDGDTLYIRKKIQLIIGLFMFRKSPANVKLTMYLPVGYDGALSAATADGDIEIDGVTMSALDVKTADGDISVDRSHIHGSVACKTHDGDIAAHSITAAEASFKTTDGDILLDRPIIGNRIFCRATDGDVKGVLAGRASDYTFHVRTMDGRSNITSGGKGKTVCEIKTMDGDIEVAFEDAG